MKLNTLKQSSIAVAVVAACAALSIEAVAQSTPAPTSGTLDVWFKAPTNGKTVSGVLSGSNCYVAGAGVVRVQFTLDGQPLNTDTTMSDGMQCVLDTTKLKNGSHQLLATASDSSGKTRGDLITININNPVAPANTAPSVSFSSPAAGTVSGTVNYAANVADDKGVTRVVFKLDGTTIADKSASPWSGSLNTTTLTNAAHSLTATAYDAEGLNTTATLALNVSNSTPTTTTTTPPPGTGSLDVWFKAPTTGKTVSGVLSGTTCYVAGTGVTKVAFFMDGAPLNVDTVMSDGMQCQLDTTKFANGNHTLLATATSSTGTTRSDAITVNVQNAGTPTPTPTPTPMPTPTPTPQPSAGGLPSDSTGVRAVPTFQSLGLYWTNPGASSTGCKIQFRKQGDSAWRDGLDLWFDARNSECRGSLVLLEPGTAYEVQMGLPGQSFKKGLVASTWSEQFPIAKTVTLQPGSSQINITQGGTKDGYVLYTAAPGTVLDVKNAADYNFLVTAPYVIIRGLTLKGAKIDAIRLDSGSHDVVVEGNDISGWGRSRSGSLGVDMDSAVRAICSSSFRFERLILQNNKIHDPRYGSNDWSSGHPAGPQGVTMWECAGNHVYRYNDIYSSSGHYYNDGIGGGENFSANGAPGFDSDIYGNRISGVYDDGIESEGANRNVRVWGNYIEGTFTGVASTVNNNGPFYVFRNVYRNTSGGELAKSGEKAGFGGGRRYFFHNTQITAAEGIKGNTNEPMTNSITRNNIITVGSSGSTAIGVIGGSLNDFDYDLSNGNMRPYTGAEGHGIVGSPTYAAGSNPSNGVVQLAPSSLGFDKGVRIPNFNDDFTGAAPDMGAQEAGTPAMKLGVQQ